MRHTSFIAFGSNLGDSEKVIELALQKIENHPKTYSLHSSKIYRSKPWGFQSDHDFFNGMVKIETSFSADELLRFLQHLEKDLGRISKSTAGYEDRVIDLDIISYDLLVLNTERLTLPHPLLHVRNFVLEPLVEIAPLWIHPLYLETSKTLWQRLHKPAH